MPISLSKIPIYMSIGMGELTPIGMLDVDAHSLKDSVQFTISNPDVAEVLRKAANNLDPQPTVDADLVYLVGDEDTGVELHCRACDRGGLPFGYYDATKLEYPDATVPTVRDLVSLMRTCATHQGSHS